MLPQTLDLDAERALPCADDRAAGRVLRPTLLARLAARMRAGELNRALSGGADPAASCQLAARAMKLTSPSFRVSLADGLERLLATAQGPQRHRRVQPRRSAVLANASELHELASLLSGSAPLYARGIAIADELVSDGTGPAYVGGADALARRLAEARWALSGTDHSDA
jgi:hypothetical protein